MTARTSRNSRPARYSRGGFTLLELLLAISLLGVVLGLAFPRIGAVRDSFLASESERALVNTVRSARLTAVRERTTVAVMVGEADAGRLVVRKLDPVPWPDLELGPLAVEGMDWSGVWEAPVFRSWAGEGRLELSADGPGIAFFAGGMSTGGRIALRDQDGGETFRLQVESGTGEVFTR